MPVISGRSESGELDDPKEGVTLGDRVPAGATEQRMEFEVLADATVEQFSVRIYQGAQLDLQLEVFIERKINESRTRRDDIVEMVGKEYIDGDDDVYEWDVSQPIEEEDKLVILATNNDGSNAYDYRANFDVDYEGGVSRGLSRLLGVFS